MIEAACAQHPTPELWWQVNLERDVRAYRNNELAKSICKRCPLRLKCLQYALDRDEREGVWGGTTPDERRQLKRQRRPI